MLVYLTDVLIEVNWIGDSRQPHWPDAPLTARPRISGGAWMIFGFAELKLIKRLRHAQHSWLNLTPIQSRHCRNRGAAPARPSVIPPQAMGPRCRGHSACDVYV